MKSYVKPALTVFIISTDDILILSDGGTGTGPNVPEGELW